MEISQVLDIEPHLEGLTSLLCHCVDAGASIGFVAPLMREEASGYWQSVKGDLVQGFRRLLIATDAGQLIGTVQLSLCQKRNGLHRAEIEKLMVHSAARGRGVGKALMASIEKMALEDSRSLLVLDTRKGDIASKLYDAIGFRYAGEIPDYASNSEGGYDATVYFYKVL